MKKFTAFILVFCMLAAALVTGLAVFAADAGTESGTTQTLDKVDKRTAFVQFKEDAGNFSARIVVAAPLDTMNKCNTASIQVAFITGERTAVASKAIDVKGIYRSIKADGDIYTAATDNVLFGVVVTSVPYGTKSVNATLTMKTGEETETMDIGFCAELPTDKTYTVSELLAVDEIAELSKTTKTSTSSKKYTCKGKVKSIVSTPAESDKTYYEQVTIVDEKDESKEILVYTLSIADNVLINPCIQVGEVITVNGYIKNFVKDDQGTLEFAANGSEYVYCIKRDKPIESLTQGVFQKVTSQNDIGEGYYLFAYSNEDRNIVLNSAVVDSFNAVEFPFDEAGLYVEEAGQYFVKLVSCDGGYAIQLPNGLYLQGGEAVDEGTKSVYQTSFTPVKHSFTVDSKTGTVVVEDTTHALNYLRYNTQSPKFMYFAEDAGNTANLTLYKLNEKAEYTTHTVTFMNGAAIYARQTVVNGKTATVPAVDPAMKGKDFDDWYTEVDGDTKFTADTPITGNVTIYAHFKDRETPPEPLYKQFQKVTKSEDLVSGGQYLIVYENTNTDTKALEAYIFTGVDAGGNHVDVAIDGGIIAYDADYYVVTITIAEDGKSCTIKTEGGYLCNSKTGENNGLTTTNGTAVTLTFEVQPDGTVKIGAPDGKTTLAFNSQSGNTNNRFRFYKNTTITGDSNNYHMPCLYRLVGTLEPEVTTHTVTFMNGTDIYDTQTVKEGKTATEPTAPIKTGFDFKGWFKDNEVFEEKFDFKTPITQDVTLYAYFEKAVEPEEPTVKQFKKVTSQGEIVAGEYLFVWEENATTGYVMDAILGKGKGGTKNSNSKSFTITDGVIEYSEDAYALVVTLIDCGNNKFKIQIKDGTYLLDTKGDLIRNGTGSEYTFTFHAEAGKHQNGTDFLKDTVNIKATNYLAYNNTAQGYIFRHYDKTTQQDFCLYKLVGGNN